MDKEQREFLSTYTSYSGSDLSVTFGNTMIGTLQQISYAIQREKTPVFVAGNPNPVSFSRGKRGIAGSLVLATFDRDELMAQMREIWDQIAPPAMFTAEGKYFGKNQTAMTSKLKNRFSNVNDGNLIVDKDGVFIRTDANKSNESFNGKVNVPQGFSLITKDNFQYADQIPPFDVTLTFANEYGQASFMKIYDLELLNEASGVSVDSTVLEKNYTWVARSISPLYRGVHLSGGNNSGTNLAVSEVYVDNG
jgi:hypothetical protein